MERPFPFEADRAEELARRESYNRHLYRPNAYLHKWWARRCGTTFRFILKALVPDGPARAFEAPGGLSGFVVLDPMMGGGTTLYEAIRMGANVIGVDIDPIPVLMVKAALSDLPVRRLREVFEALLGSLQDDLGELWETACPYCGRTLPLRFALYGRRRDCGCPEPSWWVDTPVLRREGRGVSFRLTGAGGVVDGEGREIPPERPGRILVRGTPRCPRCGAAFRDRTDLPFRERYRPVAVAGECPEHGPFFAPPRAGDLARLQQAERRAGAIALPDEPFAVRPGPKSSDLIRAGIRSYLELFTARQLLFLDRAVRFVRGIPDPLERLHMALLISTSLEFNSLLCGYKGHEARRPGAVRHGFAHHAYVIPYTALENNPLYPRPASGTLRYLFKHRLERGKRWAARPRERIGGRWVFIEGERALGEEVASPLQLTSGERRFVVLHASATDLDLPEGLVDFVVTDPPYYDNVQYGDLARFFRVWLAQMLPEAVDGERDFADRAAETPDGDPQRYAEILGRIFERCRRALKPHGALVLTFHHGRPEAWAALTIALRRGGFRLAQFEVIHAENPASVHIRRRRAWRHDAILFLRSGETGRAWTLPERVGGEERAFLAQCARALGAWLQSPVPEEAIWAWWQQAFQDARKGGLPCPSP